ncbi:AAA family ATPase [Prauserella sp. ASG 168]|uniref:AAA family ATPase n=2 Tax=Prauserella cavernicola TaxID=2800127 RepID=A0A934QS77_9PSEU|nr:AAA family ATPase [Prauserella cavernicola]
MRFGILGPLDVRGPGDAPVSVGGPKVRALLGLLLLEPGRIVGTNRLVDGIYGDAPPPGTANALQSQVSRLRQALPGLVERHPGGYRLAVAPADVDAHRFAELAAEGRTALAAGQHGVASKALREALALWRGPALADLPELAGAHAARLEELRLSAVEDRVDADLAAGDPEPLVPELRDLVAEHPLRERLRTRLVLALHACGRSAEALSAFDEARRLLADELGVDPSPELADAHLTVLRAERADPPRNGLPAQLTSFVGRDAELARVTSALASARLVTLTGPGGTGKTRLAIESARAHPGEVCFVELAPLGDGADPAQAVLDALGLRQTALGARSRGDRPARQRLVHALAERDLLLVLDNCEHLVEQAAELAGELLGGCGGLRVLATSREALGITGEALCPVPQLALPPPHAPTEDALDYPAVRLFTERAAAVAPGFALDANTADTVVHICRALDGLPLAIELAAARVRSLPVEEVATRLDDRFALLSRGSRTAAPRHRTLRSVVEWSWDLLDDEERQLARRLTVFAGGATIEAAHRVCGLDVNAVPEVLSGLAEKSLADLGADGRYRMLETVRAFGAHQLDAAGERDRLHRAHAEYFLTVVDEAQGHLVTAAQLEWMRRLDADHDNLHAAMRWAIRSDPPLALRLLASLMPYLWLRGRRTEATTLAGELLGVLEPGMPDGLEEEYAMCVFSAAFVDPEVDRLAEHRRAVHAEATRIRRPPEHSFLLVLWGAANGIPEQNTTDHLLRQSIGASADQWSRALDHFGWGMLRIYAGEVPLAQQNFAAAREFFGELGERWGLALTLNELARLTGWRGEHAEAVALFDEALELAGQLDALEDRAEVLFLRGQAHLRAGSRERAEADFVESELLARRLGTREIAASARGGLGDLARLDGDLAEAARLCEQALADCPSGLFGFDEVRANLEVSLGRIAEASGEYAEARRRFRDAARSGLGRSDVLVAALAAEGLAAVSLAEGDAAGAARLLGAGTAVRGGAIAADPDVERVASGAKAALGETGFAAAHAAGLALSQREALELAGLTGLTGLTGG